MTVVTYARTSVPGAAGVRRRLYLPALGVAALTIWLVADAALSLAHQGALWNVLRGGWVELAGPLLIAVVAATLIAERLWPAEPRPLLARGHLQDALFTLVYLGISIPVMTLLGVAFALLLHGHAGWMAAPWTASWPLWVLLPLTLITMDGANWLAHYADHRFRPLWRLHAVHHSQEELSVLTSFRAHPFVHTAGFLLATVPVFLLLGDRSIAPLLITGYVCLGTLPHANVRWSFGPLGKVVVSPAYHRVHHAIGARDGANLGIALTLWDVLARRAVFPTRQNEVAPTGLAGRTFAVEQERGSGPATLVRQLAEPFTLSEATRPNR